MAKVKVKEPKKNNPKVKQPMKNDSKVKQSKKNDPKVKLPKNDPKGQKPQGVQRTSQATSKPEEDVNKRFLRVTLNRFNIASVGVRISPPSIAILQRLGHGIVTKIAQRALKPNVKGDIYQERERAKISLPSPLTSRDLKMIKSSRYFIPSGDDIQRFYSFYYYHYFHKYENQVIVASPPWKFNIPFDPSIHKLRIDPVILRKFKNALHELILKVNSERWLITRYFKLYPVDDEFEEEFSLDLPSTEELSYDEIANEHSYYRTKRALLRIKKRKLEMMLNRKSAKDEAALRRQRLILIHNRAKDFFTDLLANIVNQGKISPVTMNESITLMEHGQFSDINSIEGKSLETVAFFLNIGMVKIKTKKNGFLVPCFNNAC